MNFAHVSGSRIVDWCLSPLIQHSLLLLGAFSDTPLPQPLLWEPPILHEERSAQLNISAWIVALQPKAHRHFPGAPVFRPHGHSARRRWDGCLRSVAGNWGTLGLYDLAATFPQKIQDDLQERRREAGERNWCVYRVLLPRTILMALLEQVKQLGRAFTARLRHAIHVRAMVQAQEYRAGRLARRLRVSRV